MWLLVWLPVTATAIDWQRFSALSAHSVLTGEEGPALRSAFTVAQDRRGRIWVGGTSGVLRLDGDLVRRYGGQGQSVLGAGFTRIVHGLDNGDVLIGTDREGVLRWELAHDRFVSVTLADGSRLSRISAIEPAIGGGAWVSGELGLYHWDAASGLLQEVVIAPLPAGSGKRVFDVAQHADGTLWVAARPGLYRRAPGQPHFEPVQVDDARLSRRLAREDAWELQFDGQGRLWVGMLHDGVVVIEPDGHAWAPAGLDGRDGLHAGTTVRALLPVDDRMWVATDGRGLLQVQQRSARYLPVNLSAFLGGRNFHVLELIRAADGRVWAASDRGVFHLDPAPQGVVELDLSLSAEHPYEQPPMVRSLLVDDRQRLWVGMFGGVVQVLDAHTGQRQLVRLPAPLDASDVVALHQDGRGRIWAASNGVALIDAQTLQVIGAGPLPRLPVQRYTAVTGDGQRVWLGGREGVLEVDLDGVPRRAMADGPHRLGSSLVRNLAWQGAHLWVGTGEGLQRIDLARWQASPVAVGAGAGAQPLPGNRFIAALAAGQDRIWAGSAEGVSGGRVDATSTLLPLLPGLADVGGVIEDGQGGLWLSTRQRGLYHRDRSGRLRHFGARSGMHPAMVGHGGAMARATDGGLMLGTRTGVVWVQHGAPGSEQKPLPDLQPQVVSLHLDGEPLAPALLPANGGKFELARTVERVALAFSAMEPVGQALRHYSYRLEGLDSRWIEAGAGNAVPLVLYSRLPVGRYGLLLRTSSDEYPGREWITRIALEVPPAWYQLRWVQALAMLLLGALAVLGMRWRLRHGRQRELRLQQKVQARTAELSQANARLAQLAGEDALTGLFNRRRAFERLDELHAWRQRMAGSDCVVLLDLDHFKQINDRHGHLGGDAVLRSVGDLVHGQLRSIDMAARYGGEELLLVLVDTTLEEGQVVCERLAQALRELRVPFNGQLIDVRASFGLALSDPGQPFVEWVERADRALYQAKQAGRDCLRLDLRGPVPVASAG